MTNAGRFTLTALPLPGLVRVQRQPLADARGFFERMFCADDLAAAGWTQPIAQINRSLTRQRGHTAHKSATNTENMDVH